MYGKHTNGALVLAHAVTKRKDGDSHSGRLKIWSENVTMVIPLLYCVLTIVLFEIACEYHVAWLW